MPDLQPTIARRAPQPKPTSEPFRCELCQEPLRLWRLVPTDCKQSRPIHHGQLYWCDRCEYGTLMPLPSADEVASFYRLDRYYTQGASHFEPEGERRFLDRLREHLAFHLDHGRPLTGASVHQALGGKPSRILDMGCGNGQLARELVELGHEVVGVETDPKAVAHDEDSAFQVFPGTAESPPRLLARESFDCVVMRHVLEHCRDPLRALRNARLLLKHGGTFMCEVPNNEAAALDSVGCSWEMLDVPRHLHFFTARSLCLAAAHAGLRVRETSFAYYARQFRNDWINTERKLWRNVMSVAPTPSPAPALNSRARAWRLLLQTVAAGKERKYDSVGLMAVRP
ncbi:MAG TPA: class I SAM-dependent methyltransferase [Polyangiales bacterium]